MVLPTPPSESGGRAGQPQPVQQSLLPSQEGKLHVLGAYESINHPSGLIMRSGLRATRVTTAFSGTTRAGGVHLVRGVHYVPQNLSEGRRVPGLESVVGVPPALCGSEACVRGRGGRNFRFRYRVLAVLAAAARTAYFPGGRLHP
jgi:hypothetical protein